MDISFQSLLIFIIITLVYFLIPSIGKPKLELTDLTNDESKSIFYNKTVKSLLFYLGFVVVSQLFLNIGYLMSKCGGSIDKNIGSASLFTFIPWILIFGVMLVVLIIFPGFKSAFSDVIGYYAVSGSANEILGTLLVDTDVNKLIDQTNDPNKKEELTSAAEAIVKICGNKSIIINQMNPENFNQIWDVLTPLMKDEQKNNQDLKQQLLDLVVLKDNIGEGIWYIYTAILISSIVYYNLATRGCIKSVDQIKAEHDQYIAQQESQSQSQTQTQTTYTA
jgi:hypothetical protein